MAGRTFFEHELERLRAGTGHRALGGDADLASVAAEGRPSADDYLLQLVVVQERPEFREVDAEIRARGDVGWLQAERALRWTEWGKGLDSEQYEPEEEGKEAARRLLLLWRALAIDAAIALSTDLADRIERVRSQATSDRLRDAYVDAVIEAAAVQTTPRARTLHHLLTAARDDDHAAFSGALDSLRTIIDRDPDVAQVVIDRVVVDRVIVEGSIRRALVNLPEFMTYLKDARRTESERTNHRRLREVEIEHVPDPTASDDPEAIVVDRDMVSNVLAFVDSLPSAMRSDWLAVHRDGRSAAEVARATERSAAALSQSLARADARIRKFLATGG